MSKSPLKIEDLSSSGEGVGFLDGKAVFVDGALPDETVEVTIIQSKKKFARAKLQKVLTPSPHRTEPICPLFGTCGGCQLMHLTYPEQLKWKSKRVQETLTRIGKINYPVEPCIASPDPLYYRHKIHLHKGGFHKKHSHTTVPITKCYIHNPTGDAKLPQVKNCREAIIRTSHTTDETMLICNGKPDRPFLTETLNNLTFRIGPKDFFQINPKQALQLYNHTLKLASLTPTSRVLDAYCGVGTLTLLAAKHAQEVIGVESGRTAIQNARVNAQLNNMKNVTFHCDLLEQKIPTLGTFDTIFLNPPRGGLHPQVLETILTHPPKKLLYISCDPATLSRDLSQLNKIFTVNTVQPFDLFPQTSHVETLVLCNRKINI
ncbi:MAG: 23S rRNA (uracil(1939)-C(5))-methyltransferase RlmD [Candidatus Algichlamydia australiensis]|nr:23S rRNA (uracil(1939)-C(5))-methyltransferase RlmD [Chlamydiales bacterium]